jgi:hypothetical protein
MTLGDIDQVFVRGRVRVAVSVDWEGRDLQRTNLAAMTALRQALPGVPLTHFLNAAYLTKPAADPAAVAQALREVVLPGDEAGLSKTGRHFIAGLLRHAREITAITNQTVNSYKRLIAGYEAPTYISWARNNESALVRVPHPKSDSESSTRVPAAARSGAAGRCSGSASTSRSASRKRTSTKS